MAVDRKDVERIAHLARIKVSAEEIAPLTDSLNAILRFAEQLNTVDIAGIEPMTAVIPQAMKKRGDIVTEGGDPAIVLTNAPAARDDFFAVPKVVE